MTVSSATSPAAATAASSSNTLSSASAAEQQDRFMKLLVAQMQNQDPLNPMDNAQMTSQIAQINTVGGIEKLNRTVESLLSAFTNMQAQSATDLPGRWVLVEGTTLAMAGADATTGEATATAAGVQLTSAADTVNVDILDAAGAKVRTISLGKSEAGVRTFGWDGLLADGTAAPAGSYRMRVTATASGKAVEARTLAPAHVISVSTGSDGVQVDLGAAGVKNYSDIKSFL